MAHKKTERLETAKQKVHTNQMHENVSIQDERNIHSLKE